MITTALIVVTVYAVAITFIAFRLCLQRDDYKRANEIRADMIEKTRQGKPPFLLNPGVKITKEEPK